MPETKEVLQLVTMISLATTPVLKKTVILKECATVTDSS